MEHWHECECEGLEVIQTVLADGMGNFCTEKYVVANKYHETILRKGTE